MWAGDGGWNFGGVLGGIDILYQLEVSENGWFSRVFHGVGVGVMQMVLYVD